MCHGGGCTGATVYGHHDLGKILTPWSNADIIPDGNKWAPKFIFPRGGHVRPNSNVSVTVARGRGYGKFESFPRARFRRIIVVHNAGVPYGPAYWTSSFSANKVLRYDFAINFV